LKIAKKNNPVRDYRSVKMINTRSHSSPLGLQPTKARRLQTCGLQYKECFIFLPNDANLTACNFEKNNLL